MQQSTRYDSKFVTKESLLFHYSCIKSIYMNYTLVKFYLNQIKNAMITCNWKLVSQRICRSTTWVSL